MCANAGSSGLACTCACEHQHGQETGHNRALLSFLCRACKDQACTCACEHEHGRETGNDRMLLNILYRPCRADIRVYVPVPDRSSACLQGCGTACFV